MTTTARPVEMKAQPVRPEAAGPGWARLQRLADAAEGAMRDEVLTALNRLRRDLPRAALEEALLEGRLERILRLVPVEKLEAALVEVESVAAGVRAAAARETGRQAAAAVEAIRVPLTPDERAGFAVGFDQQSPHVVDALTRQGAARIREITDETRAAVQQLVQRGYETGRHPREVAKEIERIVGLTTRQEAAVARLRASLEAEGVKPAKVDAQVARYAKKLRKQRAETIAQTEANRAMNDGQRAQWASLQEQGLLSPQQFEREWLTVLPAARVCAMCSPLDGARAPLGGSFPGGYQPPRHPRCRCTEVLVPIVR